MISAPHDDGWRALLTRTNLSRSLVLCGGVCLHAVNLFIVTTILPWIVTDIGGLPYFAWSTTFFVIASIVGSASVPSFIGRQGIRTTYRLAFMVFLVGSVICAIAPAMPLLLAGRTAQGLGGGMLVSLCYASIRRIFPPQLWPRAISLVSGIWGIAALAGPFVGGVFAEFGDWRAAFWSVAALSILFGVLASKILPMLGADEQGEETGSPPAAQLLLLAAASTMVSCGGLAGDVRLSCLSVAAAVACMGVLLWLDGRAARRPGAGRLLPSRPYDVRTLLGSIYLTMAMMIIGSSSLIFIPYALRILFGLGPLAAGYLSALESAFWTLTALATSSIGEAGRRKVIVLGPLIMACGLAGLARTFLVTGVSPGASIAIIGACLSLIGTGIGMTWAHLGSLAMTGAPAGERSLAAAALATNQMIATAFGSALGGLIANLVEFSRDGDPVAFARTAHWIFLLFAAAPALGAAFASRILWIRVRAAATPVAGPTGSAQR